jgi:serine protease AprX
VITIPDFIVEFFLIGRTRREALERYTQDAGIVTDVWLAFAKNVEQPQRVLIAPSKGTSAGDLGFALSRVITAYRRREFPQRRESASVSPLENFVKVTIYFDELLRLVLPLTSWSHDKNLSALHGKTGALLTAKLEQAIRNKKIHCETATDSGRERYFQGHGLLDVLRALEAV